MSLELAFPQPVIGCNQRLQYFGTARLKRDGVCWSNALHIYGYDNPQLPAALVATYGSDITPLTGAPAASHYLQRWLRGRWHYNNSWTLHTPGSEAKKQKTFASCGCSSNVKPFNFGKGMLPIYSTQPLQTLFIHVLVNETDQYLLQSAIVLTKRQSNISKKATARQCGAICKGGDDGCQLSLGGSPAYQWDLSTLRRDSGWEIPTYNQYKKKANGGFSGGCFCALLLVRSPDEHFGKSPFKKASIRKKYCKGREAGQLVFIPLLFFLQKQ